MLKRAMSYLQARKTVEKRLDAIACMPSLRIRQYFADPDRHNGSQQELSPFRQSWITSGQDNDSEASRAEKRQRVLVFAKLVSSGTPDTIRVRDISSSGARVFGLPNCECGLGVVLSKGEVLIPAHVVWKQNGEAGLKFERELSADELADLIPGVEKLSAPD